VPSPAKTVSAIAIVAVAIAAVWGGIALRQSGRSEANASVRKLFALNLPDPAGRSQRLSQWQGKILVINFWATWCEPCREEIPGLQRIRDKYVAKNVEVVGIAVDSADKVREYAKSMKVSYPLLVGGLESIELVRDFGNKAGGLPFTVVLDASPGIALSHLGLIKEQDLDQKLTELAR
jgi:thiol-disulfide isomerase/thioredoxin